MFAQRRRIAPTQHIPSASYRSFFSSFSPPSLMWCRMYFNSTCSVFIDTYYHTLDRAFRVVNKKVLIPSVKLKQGLTNCPIALVKKYAIHPEQLSEICYPCLHSLNSLPWHPPKTLLARVHKNIPTISQVSRSSTTSHLSQFFPTMHSVVLDTIAGRSKRNMKSHQPRQPPLLAGCP